MNKEDQPEEVLNDEDTHGMNRHLEEIYKRSKWIAISLFISILVGFYFAPSIIEFIKNTPTGNSIELNAFSPWETIKIYALITLIFAFVIITPMIMYHIYKFIDPALYENEKKTILYYIPFVPLLFVLGLIFGYFFIFPYMLDFTIYFTEQIGVNLFYGIANYFSFLFSIVVPLAIFFEMPLIIIFLTKLNVISPQKLRKLRKIIYFILIFIAALITPPDLFSNIVVSIPLIILFEISIFLSNYVIKRKKEKVFITEEG